MNSSAGVLSRAGFGLALLVALSIRLSAAEPLPPDIENGPAEARAEYRARFERDSLEQKIATGRQRWDQRMSYKEAVVEHLRTESASRIAYFQATEQAQALEPEPAKESSRHIAGLVCVGLAVIGVLVYHLRSRGS